MTAQEQIVELLHWKKFMFIGQNNDIFEGTLTQESEEAIADIILKAGYKSPEEAKNYVQLDEDQSLPTTRYKGWEDKPNTQWYPFAMCEKQAQQNMLKEGWRKVKLVRTDIQPPVTVFEVEIIRDAFNKEHGGEEMTEQELREKIAHIIFQKTNAVATHIVWEITDQIHSIYKASGYFQEEAEWVGHLLKKGWIPPEEAAGYVKMEKDQDLLASSSTTILDVKSYGWVKGEQKGKNEKTH